jgi:predicted nuclease of restriction endonuclease-like RecB superfamily
VKFHRLICRIRSADGNSYKLSIDGPLSLFSSTQKYGLQLALFLPALLHCKTFELEADVRWGAQKKDKVFSLTAAERLKSHTPDFGMYTPKELTAFEANFRDTVTDWRIDADPHPVPVEGTTWVPDFTLTHAESRKEVFVEVLGFWRKVDIENHYKRLKRGMAGRFVLVVSEQYRADEAGEFAAGPEVYRFKRTPIAEEVAKLAAAVAGV